MGRQIKWGIFAVIAFSSGVSSCSAGKKDLHPELPSTPYLQEVVNNIDVGSCVGEAGKVDLRQIKKLNRKQIRLNAKHREALYIIRSDALTIKNYNYSNNEKIIYVSSRLKDRPDIEMQFAEIYDETVLYWRESYKNRRYRQGIFNILDDEIAIYCEGIGGHDRQN